MTIQPICVHLRSSAVNTSLFFLSSGLKNHRGHRGHREKSNKSVCPGMKKSVINNELGRTETNSSHSEFVPVRFSSLLIFIMLLFFIIIYEQKFMADSVANFFRSHRDAEAQRGDKTIDSMKSWNYWIGSVRR